MIWKIEALNYPKIWMTIRNDVDNGITEYGVKMSILADKMVANLNDGDVIARVK